MVLPIQCLQGDSVNQLVMLSSAKHLAEPLRLRSGQAWCTWTGRDPSTPPGSALDDTMRNEAS